MSDTGRSFPPKYGAKQPSNAISSAAASSLPRASLSGSGRVSLNGATEQDKASPSCTPCSVTALPVKAALSATFFESTAAAPSVDWSNLETRATDFCRLDPWTRTQSPSSRSSVARASSDSSILEASRSEIDASTDAVGKSRGGGGGGRSTTSGASSSSSSSSSSSTTTFFLAFFFFRVFVEPPRSK